MNGMFSKVTLFDLLSMIVPGYLLLFLIVKTFAICLEHCNDLTLCIAAFAVSYIVGMLVHQVSRWVFSWLRNNKSLIERAKNKFDSDLRARNNGENVLNDITENRPIMEEYYRMYYRLTTDYSASSLPVLEAQYSFLRSMSVVGVCYALFGCNSFCGCFISLVVALTVISIALMLVVLNKLHYVVWEDSHYLNELKSI